MPAINELNVGSKVRIWIGPYKGRTGKVARIDHRSGHDLVTLHLDSRIPGIVTLWADAGDLQLMTES